MDRSRASAIASLQGVELTIARTKIENVIDKLGPALDSIFDIKAPKQVGGRSFKGRNSVDGNLMRKPHDPLKLAKIDGSDDQRGIPDLGWIAPTFFNNEFVGAMF